jgi:hypothetical protein
MPKKAVARVREVMCGTCGFEVSTNTERKADAAHRKFDSAHEANWYEDNDTTKWLGRTNW